MSSTSFADLAVHLQSSTDDGFYFCLECLSVSVRGAGPNFGGIEQPSQNL